MYRLKGPTPIADHDFFQETVLAYIDKTWDQWLGPLVPGLPSFETVIRRLRPEIARLLSPGR